MKFKKKLKNILFNILLISFVLLFFEFSFLFLDSYNIYEKYMLNNLNDSKYANLKNIVKSNIKKYYTIEKGNYFDYGEFRSPAIYDLKDEHFSFTHERKKNIIVAGCSFTYGDFLRNEDAFHSQLSRYTQRDVYNWGLSAGSPREILYILTNPKIYSKLINNNRDIDYFIYTYICDHSRRLYSNIRPISPFYIADRNYQRLKYLDLPIILNYSYLIRFINKYAYDKGFFSNSDLLFNLYMKEINNQIKNNFKKTKFVIFVYEDDGRINWTELEKEGIIIIKAEDLGLDLYDKKYRLIDGHPNAKAWEVIVPALAKELNL